MMTASSKVTILFIKANPPDTPTLDTDTEYRELLQALRGTPQGPRFDVRLLPAAQVDDILQGLLEHEPHIIHFAGHRSQYGELYFNARGGNRSQLLSAENLAETVRVYQGEARYPVRLVVLAGCFTAEAAELLAQHVDCAIGMNNAIGDDAVAQVFTPEFYRLMAHGRSVQNARDSALTALQRHDYHKDAAKKHDGKRWSS